LIKMQFYDLSPSGPFDYSREPMADSWMQSTHHTSSRREILNHRQSWDWVDWRWAWQTANQFVNQDENA
jgi:hypothetical protein